MPVTSPYDAPIERLTASVEAGARRKPMPASASAAYGHWWEPAGDGRTATLMRDSMDAIRLDFAEANRWVFRPGPPDGGTSGLPDE